MTVGRIEAFVALRDWSALADLLPVARGQVVQMRLMAPIADRAEGLMVAARGDTPAAVDLLRRALAAFAEMGIAIEVAKTQELLAEPVEDPAEATALRDAALVGYREIGATMRAEKLAAAKSQESVG